MEFGFEKCAMVVIKSGIKVKSEGIHLPSGGVITLESLINVQ